MLPVARFERFFCSDNGRPTKNLTVLMGLMVIQETNDLTNQQAVDMLAHDRRCQFALGIDDRSDESRYVSLGDLCRTQTTAREQWLWDFDP
ncbi:MAG: transposase [Deltaproteobacteria bacterium]|jgi:hypothetical protein|nr:transposase [Deltaproteobacteria bacterium]